MILTTKILKLAKRENVVRLARWLKLSIDESWSHGHVARFVRWRITRRGADFDRY